MGKHSNLPECDNVDATESHVVHAFNALSCHFTGEELPAPEFSAASRFV